MRIACGGGVTSVSESRAPVFKSRIDSRPPASESRAAVYLRLALGLRAAVVYVCACVRACACACVRARARARACQRCEAGEIGKPLAGCLDFVNSLS